MAKQDNKPGGPPDLMRNLLFAGAGCVAVLGAVIVLLGPWSDRTAVPPPSPAATQAPPPTQTPPAPAAEEPVAAPSFDVVRVNPQGSAVIAGRAAPHAVVRILDNGAELGHVTADDLGQFVFLPDAPLPAGGQELTLTTLAPDGGTAKSEGSVLLLVPDRRPAATDQPPAPVAVLTAPEAPSQLLTPAPEAPAPPPAPAATQAAAETAAPAVQTASLPAPAPAPQPSPAAVHRRLALEVVDYNDRGEIRFAGGAPAGSTVRLYIDNHPTGDATADPTGRWTMTPPDMVALGVHRLRVDQINPQGHVLARVEQPFQRSIVDPARIGRDRVLVQPGQNLWRLARVVYGSGTRYTVIYQANRDQIRDPRLIYPGQAFAVPGAVPTAASRPASEATSR